MAKRHTVTLSLASSMAPDVVVVKLGGAILTKKHQRGVLDRRGLRDCVDAVVAASRAGCSLVVVHGAGGFGHGMFGARARAPPPSTPWSLNTHGD